MAQQHVPPSSGRPNGEPSPAKQEILRPSGGVRLFRRAALERGAEEPSAIPSRVSILGHPVHPMLIPFPITFFTVLPVVDLVFVSTNDELWARAAFVILVAGIVTGVVAAAVGLVDFLGIREVRRNRVAWWHLLSNGSGVLVAVVNLLVRLPDRVDGAWPVGFVLSVVSACAILAGGWFGGELAYRHRVGVQP